LHGPIDFLSCLVSDELARRATDWLERRRKQAQFRDPQVTLVLLEEISEAALDGKRKEHMELLAPLPLLIVDDLGCVS
jgi:hypothetical protein